MQPPITYCLKGNKNSSSPFYKKLDSYLSTLSSRFQNDPFLQEFMQSTYSQRTVAEQGLELITLGLFWTRYLGAAQKTPKVITLFSAYMLQLRKKNSLLKTSSDILRGLINGLLLIPKIETQPFNHLPTAQNLKKLLTWLEATGEFSDEVKRLSIWQNYLLEKNNTEKGISRAIYHYKKFKEETDFLFSTYTIGVSHFLSQTYPSYKFREDELFCGKRAEEYHLNMVASAIMNRSLVKEFSKYTKRVVLVPSCMNNRGKSCKAVHNGLDISCMSCNTKCNIYQTKEIVEKENGILFIVPHSSSFTKWLDRWSETSDTAVVAVACLLNIAVGGYQMKEREIPSQCVLLDRCGCKKHWSKKGVPTSLNNDRLKEILQY